MLEKVTLNSGREYEPVLPLIKNDEYVGLYFTGGIDSTLVAQMLFNEYGADRVVLVLISSEYYGSFRRKEDKRTRVIHDFKLRCKEIGAEHTVFITTKDIDTQDETYGTRLINPLVGAKISKQIGKCKKLFSGFSNVQREMMQILADCNYTSKSMTNSEVREWLEEDSRLDNYPDMKQYLQDQNGDLMFVNNLAGFTYIDEYYSNAIKPLEDLRLPEIIDLYDKYGLANMLGKTISCNNGDFKGHKQCGICKSCQQRKAGFEEAGVKDPTRYVN